MTLSRHTPGGQVKIPFYGAILIPSIYGKKYAEGMVEENGKKVIISRVSVSAFCRFGLIVFRKLLFSILNNYSVRGP
ncbi:MAG: hypothetical protein IKZ02_00025 [Alphaproteobacteria bacterium]|nr:hypothetical protein [Alphaproteobacteria bacterium]